MAVSLATHGTFIVPLVEYHGVGPWVGYDPLRLHIIQVSMRYPISIKSVILQIVVGGEGGKAKGTASITRHLVAGCRVPLKNSKKILKKQNVLSFC